MENKKIRSATAVDDFYPSQKKSLKDVIKKLIRKASSPYFVGEIFGLLLPHAAYYLSGEVAGEGFKHLQGKKFETVIILADSHYEYFDGVSIWSAGCWETPLGQIKIDEDLANKICFFSKRFKPTESAHLFDHTIEVQLPFLQQTIGSFKLVPILIGSEDKDWRQLAKAISNNIKGKKLLIIVSSDLSHYPLKKEAEKLDKNTLGAILSLDTDILEKQLKKAINPRVESLLCSRDAVKVLMEVAKNLQGKAKLLKYKNVGGVFGKKEKVVGYGSVAFFR
jgi:hypothetical protein